MSRKLALLMTLTLLIGILGVTVQVQKVEATATIHIRANGSVEPDTAPISTVDNVTYTFTDNINESIVVERDNIVVDGNGCSQSGSDTYAMNVTGLHNVTIRNINIDYTWPSLDYFTYGIYVKNSNNITLINIHIERAGSGIVLHSSNNSRIENMTIPHRFWGGASTGILLQFCNNITISLSQITRCFRNIVVISSHNNVFIGNNVTLAHACNLLLEESGNNIIADNILSSSTCGYSSGLYIFEGGNNIIRGNTISDNALRGVSIVASSNNTLYNNLIGKSWFGIKMESWGISVNETWFVLRPRNNTIYHNNFIDNKKQVYVGVRCANSWDNGIEGNYWSNYTGVDLNHDGIGDSWHQINENNTDHYPLMGMFHSFNASMGYDINAISNSTIDYFEYFEGNSTIRMYVSNTTANQTYGFCRLCIPKDLMPPPYTVMIDDGLTEVVHLNDTVYDNVTYRWIYFAYPHSTHEIHVIPEFPSLVIMPLLVTATLLAAKIYGRKRYS